MKNIYLCIVSGLAISCSFDPDDETIARFFPEDA